MNLKARSFILQYSDTWLSEAQAIESAFFFGSIFFRRQISSMAR